MDIVVHWWGHSDRLILELHLRRDYAEITRTIVPARKASGCAEFNGGTFVVLRLHCMTTRTFVVPLFAHEDRGLAHEDRGLAHEDGRFAHDDRGLAHEDRGLAHE